MLSFLRVKFEIAHAHYTMNALFAQAITQFATLRANARFHVSEDRAQLVRNLFPKALFDEKTITGKTVFEIAWSFLSEPKVKRTHIFDDYIWCITSRKRRIGGLPAVITDPAMRKEWMLNGKLHRDDKDPKTGLTLPAEIDILGFRWAKKGEDHRDDRDPRTGLTLPAIIEADGTYYWCQNGKLHRDDRDPQTGLLLPAAIHANGTRDYWIHGVKIC